jgi:FixJ family two-component response regulator
MTKGLPVLVVEDDAALREAVCDTLALAGQKAISAGGAEEALQLLARHAVSLVVSDVRMLPVDGIALLKEIRRRLPHLPVVLMTAFADVDRAVEAMRAGACDFLLKPFEPQALLDHVIRYRLPVSLDDGGVIAIDAASSQLLALARRVAQTAATVLLSGESGVGKEVVARYIHQHSSRCRGPFVAINCAAIPDSLLEATLFGYEKGAFSGAQNAQAGKFEQAQKGTLLLDEITEMPLALQAKLLRVLQEREVERVGGKQPLALDIRVVATSNRDIAAAVAKGSFSRRSVLSTQCLSAADSRPAPANRRHPPAGAPFPGRPRWLAPVVRACASPRLPNGPAAARLAGQRARTRKCHPACGHPRRRRRGRGRSAAACGAAPARSTARASWWSRKAGQSRPQAGRPMTCGRSSANTSWTPWPPPAAQERSPASASGCPRERCVTSCDNIAWKGFSKADFVGIQCAWTVWTGFGEAYGKHRYRSDVEHAASDFGGRRRACRRGAGRPRGEHRLRPGSADFDCTGQSGAGAGGRHGGKFCRRQLDRQPA